MTTSDLGGLFIRAARDRAGPQWALWPSSTVPAGFVRENESYLIEAQGAGATAATLSIDGLELEALRAPAGVSAVWRWNVGFYAGRVAFELKNGPRRLAAFVLTSDPRIEKLTRDDFEHMVFDILEDSTALFSLSSFRISLGEGKDTPVPPIARLELIRSRIERLSRAVRAINRSPNRQLRATATSRHIWQVRQLDEHLYQKAIQTGSVGTTSDGMVLPHRLDIRHRLVTADTPENRFVRTYLVQLNSWLLSAADLLALVKSGDEERDRLGGRWRAICASLARTVQSLLELPTMQECTGRSALRGPTSPAFARVPQYVEFRNVYRELQKCFANVTGDFLDVPVARTFELYELWTFLRLARVAKVRLKLSDSQCRKLLQTSPTGAKAASLKRQVTLEASDVSICFQRSYNEFWLESTGIGSFSRKMIPDISIESKGEAAATVIFDAKYRIGADLNDAVASLHMYRDAILKSEPEKQRMVAGAYILTPESFATKENWEDEVAPRVFFHPKYRAEFKFGAWTMRPGISLAECERIFELALIDAGIVTETGPTPLDVESNTAVQG